MNNLRRKLLKSSLIIFLTNLLPTISFASKYKKKTINHNKKIRGFIWYLNKKD